MKKKLLAVLTVSFLVFGIAGVSSNSASGPSLQSELPNIH
jgi:hypothetical protein